MKPSDVASTAWEFVNELTPVERRAILDFQFPEMFAWWDEKPYWDAPMEIRGETLTNAEARYLYLLVLDRQGIEDCGEDLPPPLSAD